MKTRRTLSLALAALLLSSLLACAAQPAAPDAVTTPAPDTTLPAVTEAVTEAPALPQDHLGEADFDGAEYVVKNGALKKLNEFLSKNFCSEFAGGTEIKPDPDDTSKPKPAQANTQVEFSIAPTYTVTIPAKVELAEGEQGVYSGSDEISAETVLLEPNQSISVTLTSGSGFKLANEADSTVKLGYKAEAGSVTVTADNNGAVVATFGTSKVEQMQPITFTTTETPEFAGKYSDTVTFGISVKTAN